MAHSSGPEGRRAGHRSLPHTADLRVEAWAPSREECLEEAVRAVVEAFVDVGSEQAATAGRRERETVVRPGPRGDEDLLVDLLDEVVYRLDADGEVPLDVRVAPHPEGVHAVWAMAWAGVLPVVGAVPKAVTLHGLALDHTPRGWRCAVTLDV
ncbi:archease [Streptomyces sp. 4N509B]|uniref:archease n=1 Tax=Streptomyces sp. 4N509B TaxID=3457413 RepID=UPI003FD2B3ED